MMCKENQALYLSVVLEIGTQSMAELFHTYQFIMVSVIIQKKWKRSELIKNVSLAKGNLYYIMTHWLFHKYPSEASTLAKPFILIQCNPFPT